MKSSAFLEIRSCQVERVGVRASSPMVHGGCRHCAEFGIIIVAAVVIVVAADDDESRICFEDEERKTRNQGIGI
jgi:hypothetical protein